jgi:hypothetical protein
MEDKIRKLDGANMDIDLTTPAGEIVWRQDACLLIAAEGSRVHQCALKNVSISPHFCGIEYLDSVLCCYPHPNPLKVTV